MLDQLVESRNTSGQNTFRNGLLLTFFILMVTFMASGWLWSLFAREFGMGNADLELSSLITPVPVPENEPPKPEPEKPEEKQQAKQEDNVATRKDNILALDESPPKEPPPISSAKMTSKERPKGNFKIDPNAGESENQSASNGPSRNTTGPSGPGVVGTPKPQKPDEEEEPQRPTPTPTPKPVATATPKPPPSKPISGGVLNGKATSLPKPAYPAAAKAVRAGGSVSVQVTIDENGSVISANATSGHPLLRGAAESAARGARFSPTLLSGQKVKVTGVITYNFVQ
jgi:TonB family protein